MRIKVSIARIATNPSIRFINAGISKNMTKIDMQNAGMVSIYCSELSDNKTTYVQEKVFDNITNTFIYPPYVECSYVD